MKDRLITERLILRKLQKDDLHSIFVWASDPEVARYLTWNPHPSIEVTRSVLNVWLKDYENSDVYRYGITLKETGELIGMIDVVGYHHDDPVIGYASARKYWNNGYMTEALRALKNELLEKFAVIVIEADVNNIGSNRVIQKNGFELVTTYEKVMKKDGIPAMINSYRYYKKEGQENG